MATKLQLAKSYIDGDFANTDAIPTDAGLADALGVSVVTLRDNPIYTEVLDRLKAKQERVLLNKGLTSEYNATITKLVLSSKHGYVERTKNETDIHATLTPDDALADSFARFMLGKKDN